ncbi:hypothetical protein D3C86_2257240 [compost metagenome]
MRAQGVDALCHFQQGTVQAMEQPFATLGQAHLARQAFEQGHTQPALEGADLV